MSDKLYNILVKVQRFLPAVGVFYLGLCKVWPALQYGDQVNQTLALIATLLAATLEIAIATYNSKKEE